MTSPGETLSFSVANTDVLTQESLQQNAFQKGLQYIGRVAARATLSLSLAVGGGVGVGVGAEVMNPHPDAAVAYDASTGDYPWADAAPLNVATYDYGYKTCPTDAPDCMTKKYVKDGTAYGQYDPWKYYFRNCTSYVAWRLAQEFGADARDMENATKWDNHATDKKWTVDHTPEVGDIAQFEGDDKDQYNHPGHVAFVEEIGTGTNAGKVRVAEYNQDGKGNFAASRWVGADNYIDVNGPNPADFTLKIGSFTSSPTTSPSPVTAISTQQIGSSEHVYWATADGKLRETWFSPGQGVFTNLIMTFGHKIMALSSEYTPGDMTQHVYSGDDQGVIRETWFSPTSGGYHTWEAYDADGAILSMSSRVDAGGTQHVYWGSDNGQVKETWFNPSQGAHTWEIAHSNSPVYGLTDQYTGDGVEHVYWGNTEGRLHESFFRPGWGPFTNVMAQFPQPVSSLSSQTTPDGAQHVFSGSNDGKVRETWFNTGTGYHTWEAGVFGSAVHAVASQYTADGNEHIYSGTDDRVRETWFHPGTVNSWEAATSSSPIRAISSQVDSGGTTHVFWGADDGRVRETWFGSGGMGVWELPG